MKGCLVVIHTKVPYGLGVTLLLLLVKKADGSGAGRL